MLNLETEDAKLTSFAVAQCHDYGRLAYLGKLLFEAGGSVLTPAQRDQVDAGDIPFHALRMFDAFLKESTPEALAELSGTILPLDRVRQLMTPEFFSACRRGFMGGLLDTSKRERTS